MSIELPTLYQQFIHLSRYSRYRYEDSRRETWTETVDRYFGFFEEHLSEQCNFKVSTQAKNTLRNAVLNLEIMYHYSIIVMNYVYMRAKKCKKLFFAHATLF